MKNNYLVIALRNIFKRKNYTLLNITGLAIGMACCLFIFQYVSYERSYDTFQPDAANIVRLRLDAYQNGKLSWQSATVYPAIAPTMKKDFPEVENFCRLHDAEFLMANEDRDVKFSETKGYFADPSTISILDVNMKDQNTNAPLDGPNRMIISESFAKKYFGTEDPLG